MRYAYFEGCKIPYFAKEYGVSALALLRRFDLEVLEIEFNCCGYPVRDIDFPSFVFSGARNLALAEQKGCENIVTPCKCCYGSLKFVEHYLRQDQINRDLVNAMLQPEGLQWEGRIRIKHLVTVLHEDIGLDAMRACVRTPLSGLKVAAHTGCHALRPGHVTRFDNPVAPAVLDDLVAVTGAENIDWPMSTECCGNPQWDKNRDLALKQMHRKLASAKLAGADYVCTACTYCQIQFAQKQPAAAGTKTGDPIISSILISQLVGLSVGLTGDAIGMREAEREKLLAHAGRAAPQPRAVRSRLSR
jgi:heterodisulfide reductase subunit B